MALPITGVVASRVQQLGHPDVQQAAEIIQVLGLRKGPRDRLRIGLGEAVVAPQQVVARAAADQVGPGATVGEVIARAHPDGVGARTTKTDVIAVARAEQVITHIAEQQVIARVAPERVVAGQTVEDVGRVLTAREVVVPRSAVDDKCHVYLLVNHMVCSGLRPQCAL